MLQNIDYEFEKQIENVRQHHKMLSTPGSYQDKLYPESHFIWVNTLLRMYECPSLVNYNCPKSDSPVAPSAGRDHYLTVLDFSHTGLCKLTPQTHELIPNPFVFKINSHQEHLHITSV